LRDVDQFIDADAESDAAGAFRRRVAIVFAADVVTLPVVAVDVPLALDTVGLTLVRQQRFRPPAAKPVAKPITRWLGIAIVVVGRRTLDADWQ
jgi:hypothetical protein